MVQKSGQGVEGWRHLDDLGSTSFHIDDDLLSGYVFLAMKIARLSSYHAKVRQ